ncbi:ABC transporter ATP-binding protein [Selenihalanaerobacter shriftii]|uniref:NitT/TauT family transport system ATP-binding protein n=1 Tax=Selenihalanaerobacter shriftii TaxID=142842 RepID=A0A1T4R601_9FIRM|nr:ABC transporter ATP-binding protein [Selenihalanaerobacter shriftii]SKA11266.1 NitT/TauT family transport system ATP-binding protein [Selenihalanaerobacter shriftii]
MIKIKNIFKDFQQKDGSTLEVLNNIDFTIKEGEFVSLLGPSGCGKSTLLNIVAGLESSTNGEVLIDNKPITDPGVDRGVVFQEAALFPWLTVLENVKFGLKSKDLTDNEIEKNALNHIKKVHLSKFKDSYPHQLSGGMKQRTAIARSLAINPKTLLMDEPFGALDEQTRMMLQFELQKIWLETKKTILFVTHNIREAVQLSNRIVVFGTQPGTIKEIFEVKAGRPRNKNKKYLLELESKIMNVLKEEIEKTMKEEMDDDYHFEEGSLPWDPDRDMGSSI